MEYQSQPTNQIAQPIDQLHEQQGNSSNYQPANKPDKSQAGFDWFTLICRLVIIGAFVVVAMISILSELGMHPDEWDVKACLDWGMNHWIWPDMRAEGLGDTYSWYGYTKVCNKTPYFLIMGKIAYVFKQFMGSFPYYRMPNLLLMAGMTVITVKNLREKKYLMLGFGMCVQAWYIFSYVTADALDFVWAYIAIYLLADESSILWKTIDAHEDSGTKGRIILNCILLGLLYGMMLLGKPYYYANMVLTFIVLLIHLIKSGVNEKKTLWKRYILIVLVCGLIFAARYGLDLHYYGFDKSEISDQMSEIYSSDDKKPSTPVEDQDITYHMASKGYSVSDLFKYDKHWFMKSYRSFVSARVTIEGDDWYYIAMAILYLAIYLCIGIASCRGILSAGKGLDEKKTNMLIFAGGTLLMIGGVIASICNSYLIDSQAQGRYLLPIALTMAYLGSRVPRLWEKKEFKALVTAAACLSIIYFGLFDSRKLIDLAYVRTLFGL